jgi:K+-transporting ATPase ATPase A chain
MTINGWLQIFVFLGLVFLVTKPLGVYMVRVFSREKTFMDPVLRPVERLLYRGGRSIASRCFCLARCR